MKKKIDAVFNLAKKRLHAFVSGHVQGVCFRIFTVRAARKLGLRGFVKNLSDGRVEVIAEGQEEMLKQLLVELNTGPPGAGVESIDIEWTEAENKFTVFETRY